MPRYFAFLRAINVGGHTVKMDRLRELFRNLGFANVETFISSGNVIFESEEADEAALERRTERHLEAELGYEVGTYLRSAEEVARIAAYRPFPEEDPAPSLYVILLHNAPPAPVAREVEALRTETDEFKVHGREAYWLCRTRISESPGRGARLVKALREPGTMRNSTTMRRLAAKYP